MANYDIGDALSRIENILLDSIGRNMKRHLREEADLQKAWSMWQTEQLTSLGNWSAKNYQQFAPQFTKINNSAMNLLRQANQNGELNQEIKILQTGIQNAQRFFDVPDDKLDSLLKSVRSDLSRAEHAILRKADDVYREALFDSHFYLESGSGTLNAAIDMAVEDLHQRGLNSVTYRNGAHVPASSYARMALRSANERAQLLGEGKARDKFGIHTVIVPPSGIACPKCAPWLCRVLVDDVYSAGTPAEAADLNLPLLSEAIRQGFLHPQCNCSPQTYFPDSPVPEMSEHQREEAVRKYQITQRQRYNERQIRKWKQVEKSAPDEAAKKSASARKREWQKRNKDLVDQHSDFLRRDYFREKIYDNQTPPITPNVIDKPTPPEPAPKITEAKPAVISENSPKTLDFSAQSDIIELRDIDNLYKPVTQEAIDNVPELNLFDNAEMNLRHHQASQELLHEVMRHSELENGTEFSIRYEANMLPIVGENYRQGAKGHVGVADLGRPFHAFHNHASDETFSYMDLYIFSLVDNMLSFTAQGQGGSKYVILRTPNSDGYAYWKFLSKKSNEVFASFNDDEFTLDFITNRKERQVALNAVSKLNASQKEYLKENILQKTLECLEGAELYGFKYISQKA